MLRINITEHSVVIDDLALSSVLLHDKGMLILRTKRHTQFNTVPLKLFLFLKRIKTAENIY
jgi:hypothetical protein